MRRAVKIGSVTLDRSLYYTDEYEAQDVSANSERTIDGGVIVWEQANKITTNNLTLESLESYPISEDELKNIQTLINGSLGSTVLIEFQDSTNINTRFRHEEKALEYEPIYEGACYYNVTIKLARV